MNKIVRNVGKCFNRVALPDIFNCLGYQQNWRIWISNTWSLSFADLSIFENAHDKRWIKAAPHFIYS